MNPKSKMVPGLVMVVCLACHPKASNVEKDGNNDNITLHEKKNKEPSDIQNAPPPPVTNSNDMVTVTEESYGYDMSYAENEAVYYSAPIVVSEPEASPLNGRNNSGFLNPRQHPLSTFSIDVDRASYTYVRNELKGGRFPQKENIRVEEMINYFNYSYPQPTDGTPFSVNMEMSSCPWNDKHQLLLVGLQGKELPKTEQSTANLVFLVDVSGSMQEPNKLPLVKQSMSKLVDQLDEDDRVSMVVYAGNAGLVLPPTSGSEKQKIRDAIDRLEAGGSTAGGEGIILAYKQAEQNFIKGGNNRVILATDGDFNVGITSDDDLVSLIEEKRKTGIFLTVLGFGTGNYQDVKMEKLADKGNGNYAYIDNEKEAEKVLVAEFTSTMYTIAKDVKLQVEFNPAYIKGYRLIGYENRRLENWEFNDDTRDAGELGAGHTVTALYEVELSDVPVGKFKDGDKGKDMVTVNLRYKLPDEDQSHLLVTPLKQERQQRIPSNNLKFASSVAGFGMLLVNSDFKGTLTYPKVWALGNDALGMDKEGYRNEFLELVMLASKLDTGK